MRSSTRYILLLIGVLILVIVMVLLFSAFNRPSTKTSESPANKAPLVLSSYAGSNATVSYTVDGTITGNDEYRAIKIIISGSASTVQVLKGYQGQVLKSQTTANNTQAFQQFLAAIQVEGFLTKLPRAKVTNMEGQCSLGNRFIVSATGISEVTEPLWSSNCGKIGTWGGNTASVARLFTLQVPNYNQFVSGVVL